MPQQCSARLLCSHHPKGGFQLPFWLVQFLKEADEFSLQLDENTDQTDEYRVQWKQISYSFTSCKYSQSKETENKYIKSKGENVTELVNTASECPLWVLGYTHRNCKQTIILKYVCVRVRVCVCVCVCVCVKWKFKMQSVFSTCL